MYRSAFCGSKDEEAKRRKKERKMRVRLRDLAAGGEIEEGGVGSSAGEEEEGKKWRGAGQPGREEEVPV
jgi:hypothetical protein